MLTLMCCICCCSWLSTDCNWCHIWPKHQRNVWCTKSSKANCSRDSICCMVQDSHGSLRDWRIFTIQVITWHVSDFRLLYLCTFIVSMLWHCWTRQTFGRPGLTSGDLRTSRSVKHKPQVIVVIAAAVQLCNFVTCTCAMHRWHTSAVSVTSDRLTC